tara:strand:+ start:306 stop:500 length:195 start_codon:yes stop_codon:yes gene_type:complete
MRTIQHLSFDDIGKKKRIEAQNYEGAFSEFKLANAINPNNREVNQLLLKALSILCYEENKYFIN